MLTSVNCIDFQTVRFIPNGRKSQDVLSAIKKISTRKTPIAANVTGHATMSFDRAAKEMIPDFAR